MVSIKDKEDAKEGEPKEKDKSKEPKISDNKDQSESNDKVNALKVGV